MRSDGRQSTELRPVTITPGFLPAAEGSALIEMGHTKVICSASLDEAVPSWLRGGGRGWITAEYGMLPRATTTRVPREVTRGRPAGRTQEIQRLIGRALRSVTRLELLGERTIHIDCDVLQADGGTRTAAITGGWVALALALKQMVEFRMIGAMPLREPLAAISVGVVEGVPTLDLCYEEDSRAEVDMNVVMTAAGEYAEVQSTGESRTFTLEQLQQMLELAKDGIAKLIEVQKTIVTL
jgi:ribonuclease PH